MSNPWIRFFPRDWSSDVALRSCSLEARGLWIEMLGLMVQQEDVGYLPAEWCSGSAETLVRLIGSPADSVIRALRELVQSGVASVDPTGRVYSRRILRDELRRRQNAANGRRGGNPVLVPANDGRITDRIKLARARTQDSGLRTQDTGTQQEPASQGGSRRSAKPRAEPTGDAAEARRHWDEVWERTHFDQPYSWSNQADFVAIAKCVKLRGSSLPEVKRRIEMLLETPSDQWKAQNATPRILLSQWDTLAVEVRQLNKSDAYTAELAKIAKESRRTNGEMFP